MLSISAPCSLSWACEDIFWEYSVSGIQSIQSIPSIMECLWLDYLVQDEGLASSSLYRYFLWPTLIIKQTLLWPQKPVKFNLKFRRKPASTCVLFSLNYPHLSWFSVIIRYVLPGKFKKHLKSTSAWYHPPTPFLQILNWILFSLGCSNNKQ